MGYGTFLTLEYMKKIAKVYPDLDGQLLLMSDMTKKLIEADRCTIWLYDEKTDELWSKVADGVERLRIPAETGIAGHVFQTGDFYISNDVEHDCFHNKNISKSTGYITKSMITIPLRYSDGYCFGVFQVLNKLDGSKFDISGFSENDIEVCHTLSHYCEQALINSILEQQLNSSQNDLIFLLSGIVESRSKETANHVTRVSEICGTLAGLYGLKEDQIQIIKIASALHDVGKIGVPDGILNKPGKLTDEEMEVMKQHTSIGYNILKDIETKVMDVASHIAHEHHERYNGKGYPRGIAGDKISIYARIASIADVFDALACERCYKKPWPREKIVSLFKEEKGEQFDPILTELFLGNLDIFFEILHKYPDIEVQANEGN